MDQQKTEKITDMSYLSSVCGDDADFKIEMIDTFLKNTPVLLDEMKDHLRARDWKKIGDIAHKMKPSITFMGINPAKGLILELERNGRSKEKIEMIPSMVEELNVICIQAFEELNDEMIRLQSS